MYSKCRSRARGLTPCCSSSSSDEEDEYYRDVQLRKDIHQLERALNTVDTELENKTFRHRHKQVDIEAVNKLRR